MLSGRWIAGLSGLLPAVMFVWHGGVESVSLPPIPLESSPSRTPVKPSLMPVLVVEDEILQLDGPASWRSSWYPLAHAHES